MNESTTRGNTNSHLIADGTPANPYPVKSPEDLFNVRKDLHAHYRQLCDINLKSYEKEWEPIGTFESPFMGQYDGNDFKIENLYFSSGLDDIVSAIGLFGTIENAALMNIRIDGAYIAAFVSGILVGVSARDSEIINCHVRNSFTGGRGNSGLVNDIIGGTIDRCSSVTVARLYTCGYSGIFGTACGTVIKRSWAKVDIEFASKELEYKWQSDTFCGFGQTAFGCQISDCYAVGKTNGRLWQCGFLQNFDFDEGEYFGVPTVITNCYAAVELKSIAQTLPPPYYSKDPMTGGFAYEVCKDACKEAGCYFNKELAGTEVSVVGMGVTTSQMQSKGTYKGWDFTKVWEIKDKSYPTLQRNKEV